ncbi:MAG TPA: ATP-binding protein [Myxococcales bacterium]|nr:ATP-binding protein [Myxococcales bacterium]
MSLERLQSEVRRLKELLQSRSTAGSDLDRLRAEMDLHQVEIEAQHQELQEAHGRLELSQARYSALYHGAPVAFCTLDRQGLILELNDAAAALLGRAPALLPGWPLMMAVAEGYQQLFWEHLRRCAERQGRVCTELTLAPSHTRELQVQFLSISGPTMRVDRGFHTAILDVTAEREAQRRLQTLATVARRLADARDERAALEAVCAATVDGMVDACAAWLDEPEGGSLCAAAGTPRVAERLRQALESRSLPSELVGLARETGAGSAVMGLTPKLSAWLFEGEGVPATVAMAVLEARHGTRGWVMAAVRRPRGAFATEDLLVMQQLAERLGQSVQWLRLYRKALREVRVREDFLAIVSHDLVNAAASIKLTAEAMDSQAVASSQHANVARIRSSAEWIMSVVRKLLDVAALESGVIPVEAEPLPAGALLEEARDALAPAAAERRIELKLSPGRDAWVRADADRLLQVFSNLVLNAVKHAPEGSTVELAVRRAGPEVLFSVQDQGPGIAREDLPHVFDRFWQARRAKRAGVGLGLSIVKAIVEAHGGRVWTESGEQGGATFWFVLPAIESPAASAPQAAAERRQEERA